MDRLKIFGCMLVLSAGVAAATWAAFVGAVAVISATDQSDPDALWLLIPAAVGLIAAALALRPVRNAGEVIPDLPVISSLASACRYLGIMAGALTAALSIDHIVVRIIAAIAAVAAAMMLVLRVRSLRDEVTDTRTERVRIAALHAHGRRVRAQVVEVTVPGVWSDSLALFQVGAEYTTRSGTHRVDEQLLLPIADAPVVGGTVLLWTVADDSDPLNVLMEADPDSIRHPDPDQFLEVPDTHQPDPLKRMRW